MWGHADAESELSESCLFQVFMESLVQNLVLNHQNFIESLVGPEHRLVLGLEHES